MAKSKVVWEADNGNHFETEQECLDYEREWTFGEWYYEGNELPLGDFDEVEDTDVYSWLLKHRDYILGMLSGKSEAMVAESPTELQRCLIDEAERKESVEPLEEVAHIPEVYPISGYSLDDLATTYAIGRTVYGYDEFDKPNDHCNWERSMPITGALMAWVETDDHLRERISEYLSEN